MFVTSIRTDHRPVYLYNIVLCINYTPIGRLEITKFEILFVAISVVLNVVRDVFF